MAIVAESADSAMDDAREAANSAKKKVRIFLFWDLRLILPA
jgi:hypothetical protein